MDGDRTKDSKSGEGAADLKARLSPLAYRVTQNHGTERAFTHDNFPKVPGVFRCVVCGTELFDQATKYDSGSGWPSFYAPKDRDAVGTSEDNSHFMRRTEVHCAKCEAHLGHVFPDGPQPTGLRYCINGVALDFDAED